MSATKKKITKKLIYAHFGPHVAVKRKLFGGFNVVTPYGGDIDIFQDQFKIHSGGKDVYRSMVSLGNDAWGGLTASGPNEHVIAMMSYGDNMGVSVTPQIPAAGGGCFRFFAAVIVFGVVMPFSVPNHRFFGFSVAWLITSGIWKWSKKASERASRRRGQTYRDLQPDIYGDSRDTSHDDAAGKDWL